MTSSVWGSKAGEQQMNTALARMCAMLGKIKI